MGLIRAGVQGVWAREERVDDSKRGDRQAQVLLCTTTAPTRRREPLSSARWYCVVLRDGGYGVGCEYKVVLQDGGLLRRWCCGSTRGIESDTICCLSLTAVLSGTDLGHFPSHFNVSGTFQGYGFVEFETSEAAQQAIQ
eukprot:2623294-Rhodomonas_salina.1